MNAIFSLSRGINQHFLLFSFWNFILPTQSRFFPICFLFWYLLFMLYLFSCLFTETVGIRVQTDSVYNGDWICRVTCWPFHWVAPMPASLNLSSRAVIFLIERSSGVFQEPGSWEGVNAGDFHNESVNSPSFLFQMLSSLSSSPRSAVRVWLVDTSPASDWAGSSQKNNMGFWSPNGHPAMFSRGRWLLSGWDLGELGD